ncbi:hypothetical protein FB45DRAFT_1021700 [Roridomyces roridus]|uniref:Uncharacterized protein n=1 Tax=Roridomyces roridus TaxID=1738132 RepID=A0AAD7CCH8_9AGAR|nr:hypothetical protein FB45DRAFT_1021700 [Roridomyces roridus]
MAVGIPPEGYVGFEQYTLTPANLVGKIPCSLDYDEAASIPAGYATAAIGLLAKSRGAVHTADIPAAVLAYDAISEPDTQEACFELVSAGGTVVAVLQQTREYRDVDGKKLNVHGEFGVLMWRLLAKQLEEGIIRVGPNRIEKLPNGLAGIVDGSKRMENMAVSGVKLVAFPQETA